MAQPPRAPQPMVDVVAPTNEETPLMRGGTAARKAAADPGAAENAAAAANDVDWKQYLADGWTKYPGHMKKRESETESIYAISYYSYGTRHRVCVTVFGLCNLALFVVFMGGAMCGIAASFCNSINPNGQDTSNTSPNTDNSGTADIPPELGFPVGVLFLLMCCYWAVGSCFFQVGCGLCRQSHLRVYLVDKRTREYTYVAGPARIIISRRTGNLADLCGGAQSDGGTSDFQTTVDLVHNELDRDTESRLNFDQLRLLVQSEPEAVRAAFARLHDPTQAAPTQQPVTAPAYGFPAPVAAPFPPPAPNAGAPYQGAPYYPPGVPYTYYGAPYYPPGAAPVGPQPGAAPSQVPPSVPYAFYPPGAPYYQPGPPPQAGFLGQQAAAAGAQPPPAPGVPYYPPPGAVPGYYYQPYPPGAGPYPGPPVPAPAPAPQRSALASDSQPSADAAHAPSAPPMTSSGPTVPMDP